MKYLSPLELIYKWEVEKQNEVFLSQPIKDEWHNWTWKETMIEVRKMASYLKSLNLEEKSKVGILSKNRFHQLSPTRRIRLIGITHVEF